MSRNLKLWIKILQKILAVNQSKKNTFDQHIWHAYVSFINIALTCTCQNETVHVQINEFSYNLHDFSYQWKRSKFARQSTIFWSRLETTIAIMLSCHVRMARSTPRIFFVPRRYRWVAGIERQAANRNGNIALLDVDWWEHRCVFRLCLKENVYGSLEMTALEWIIQSKCNRLNEFSSFRCIIRSELQDDYYIDDTWDK